VVARYSKPIRKRSRKWMELLHLHGSNPTCGSIEELKERAQDLF
jgi:hypothetical protein